MKRLILPLFLILLTSAHSISASYYSSLYLDLDRNKYYEATLDGEEKSGYGKIHFRNVDAGNKKLKIYEIKNRPGSYHKDRKLIYNDYIRLERGCEVYAYFDNWNKLYFDKRNCEDEYHYYDEDYLSNREFQEALQTIRNQSFESGKEVVAKQIISDYNISVDQLVDILKEMSFESTKLELAKYAYDNMRDVRGFYKVYNVFSFSSSVDELSEYIESRKKNSSDW
jgi:hypothetical protein